MQVKHNAVELDFVAGAQLVEHEQQQRSVVVLVEMDVAFEVIVDRRRLVRAHLHVLEQRAEHLHG